MLSSRSAANPGEGGPFGLSFVPRADGLRLTVQRSFDVVSWDEVARLENGSAWQVLLPGATVDVPGNPAAEPTFVAPPASTQNMQYLRLVGQKL